MKVVGSAKSEMVHTLATRFRIAALMVPLLAVGCAADQPKPIQASPETQAVTADARRAAQAGELAYALELLQSVLGDLRDPQVVSQAARLAVALEDWPAALETVGRWTELAPGSRQAAQIALLANLQLGRIDPAVEVLAEDLIAPAEDREAAWVGATQVLARAGDPDLAAQVIARALARGSSSAPGLEPYLNSRVAAAQGRTDRAYSLAERAHDLSPGYERAFWAGRLARSQARAEEALAWFRAASASKPGDRLALMGQVEMLRSLERPEQALSLLTAADADAEMLYTRGVLEQELGRIAAAGATWQRLAALDPSTAGSRHAWLTALLAELLSMNERAEQWYARVEGAFRPRADLRRAAVMARAGDPDRAQALLAELRVGGDPEIRERAWLMESGILLEEGDPERAIEILSEALAELPGSADLLYSRAMAAVNADELSLAEQDLRAIIQSDPDNAMALNALGYTLSDRTDRQREALRLIETALDLDPDNPAILDSMGWVLFKLGRPAEAVDFIQRAAAADPHPEIVSHLIEVLWTLDRRDEALAWIDRLGPRFRGEQVFDATLDRLGIE